MPSHDRAPSSESALTSLSGEDASAGANASFASDSSEISTRSSTFLEEVATIIESDISLSNLANKATQMIALLASHDMYNRVETLTPKATINVQLNRVLDSMLHYAHECGGERGRRYTAAAICACSHQDDEETLKYLQSLATTWLSHLLYVFKANGSHKTQLNSHPSENATPTLERTAGELVTGATESRGDAFKEALLKRDGYRCVVSGSPDVTHPAPDEVDGLVPVDTIGCHILRRAIAVFDAKNLPSKATISAYSTFDILRNYASLPVNTLSDIAMIIDDPSNGMTLEYHAHRGFDVFAWSLAEVKDTPNTYTVVIHDRWKHRLVFGVPDSITFKDHSVLNLEPPRKKQRNTRSGRAGDIDTERTEHGIPLPNPLFIRIHHAIAGILHMSGAGEEIDAAIERMGGAGSSGAVVTGDDFYDSLLLSANVRFMLTAQ